MSTIPATSTVPMGHAAFVRAARDMAEAAERAVGSKVAEGDRALSVLGAAGQRIARADEAALSADMAHTEASEVALEAASVLAEATKRVNMATDPVDVWVTVRQSARDEARWSGGTFTFEEADARAEVARDEARRYQFDALAEHRAARTDFDAAAAALASAARRNADAEAAAEAATTHAEQAIAYARRIIGGLERVALMADAAATALEAIGSPSTATEADLVGAEASHARNVLAEVARAVDTLSVDVN